MKAITYLKRAGVAVAAVATIAAVGLAAPQAQAQDKGTMRVAFGDVPGGEMVNFMIAVARAANAASRSRPRSCSPKTLPPRPSSAARLTSASARPTP